MDEISWLIAIKYWIYIFILIPSIICAIFVLYYLLFDRTLRRALNNHVIIVPLFIGLICQVTMYPWMLYYYHHQNHWERSYRFCSIWGFIDWGLYITQGTLFAWASIERHILIFHDSWLRTKKKRFFIHYLPLIFLMIYSLIFYSIIFFFPNCKNFFNDYAMVCISSCLFHNYFTLNMWEVVVHGIIPTLIIVIFSIGLIIRVVQQKQRIHQVIQWRKHRKMTIQLLLISFLYLILFFPNTLMIFLYACILRKEINRETNLFIEFFSYLVILLFPFVCIISLPELRNKIMKILPLKRPARTIHPKTLLIENNMNIKNIH